MSLFDAVADLPLVVESGGSTRHERDTSSGFLRKTTVFELRGDGAAGRGEDVTYDAADHDALRGRAENADPSGASSGSAGDLAAEWGLAGEWRFREFSAALDGGDLFSADGPGRDVFRNYRRWAVESAALDLALRQAETSLGDAVGRDYDPVRFVASTRLGDPPAIDRVAAMRERVPSLEFKLDPRPDWDADLIDALAETGAVRILDLKGQYEGTDVDNPADPTLYRRVFEAFPDAVVEDPGLTDATEPLVREHADRIAWDYPITGVGSVEALPFEPRWLNVKPSRFGTVESLFETIEWAAARNASLYGGGQFELSVGRSHVQALASLFYPDAPNDVAPGAYNDPTVPDDLPAPPLDPSADPRGLML